ncbi:thylakoid lumenal 17.4 kDa protein, chloroplastic [Iris pallida]|uniref:Thylakoid lumenal 17.4 kDa protein, chloroplastic n=1 Tax=Iris pallida TaxID=29817 RepID=A0AAX6IR20_IRIPA|nr:thylakoid lumenal 17.4 kDa protein, chloroplastic [Iris pallida]
MATLSPPPPPLHFLPAKCHRRSPVLKTPASYVPAQCCAVEEKTSVSESCSLVKGMKNLTCGACCVPGASTTPAIAANQEKGTGRRLGTGTWHKGLWYLDRTGLDNALASLVADAPPAASCRSVEADLLLHHQRRLPPLSTEPNRCERAFVGNTIGQANGVYDKPIDLRFCDFTNDKSNLKGKSLAAALMSDAKFDGANMSEVVMSKAYAVGASFKGVDFSNAVIDRVNFEKANLQGAIFKNAVLSGSTFNDAQLQDAVFEDTIIGYIDLQKLCVNPTISEEGRAELGCR